MGTLFGSDLVWLHKQLMAGIDEQEKERYLEYLKEWICGKMSEQEFDVACMKLLPDKLKSIHHEILSNLIHDLKVRSSEFSAKAGSSTMLDGYGWDFSRKQIKRRLLLGIIGNKLEWQADDEICSILLNASKMFVKNILEGALKMKRSYLVNSVGICHMFGARKRRAEGDCLSGSYVVLPARTPVSAADVVDSLRVDSRLLCNSWFRRMLIERLDELVTQSQKKIRVVPEVKRIAFA